MRRRVFLLGIAGAALACSLDAGAAQPEKVHQLGFLGATSRAEYSVFIEAMEEGLRQRGYADGRNLVIHYRWAEGRYERLPDLAAELVRLPVEIILTHGGPGARAAKAATETIPIIGIVVGDLVAGGLVTSLARPGGNLTGQTFFFPEVNAKRLELIKEAVPQASRVAVLVNAANDARHAALAALQQTAQTLQLELLPTEVKTRGDLAESFESMTRQRAQALVVTDDAFLISNAEYISELAAKNRLPMIDGPYGTKPQGFMTYGADLRDLWFRSAVLIDQVLKGAKPADLPVQQATKFDLVINLQTARALGITVPPALLARADEVIE